MISNVLKHYAIRSYMSHKSYIYELITFKWHFEKPAKSENFDKARGNAACG